LAKTESEWPKLAAQSRDIWNQNAECWDTRMGDVGNDTHNLLVRPATESLLDIRPGETVLDIACGNGNFSRRLAEMGATVVAFDTSEGLIERACARSTEYGERITYAVIDAGDRDQLAELGEGRFDAAVSNMALMDMAVIVPLLESLARLLKPGGRFVFSVGHPCFQSPGMAKVLEQREDGREIVTDRAVKVSAYITPATHKGLAIIGQPAPQHYFHRPLSVLFGECFRAGFVLDGLEEPAFGPDVEANRPTSWAAYPEIPPILVARLRLR
jgi:2-polyprenyl-3-methyl-5-hydroxy-6-metoxy-1,4-benzoquinol methylase